MSNPPKSAHISAMSFAPQYQDKRCLTPHAIAASKLIFPTVAHTSPQSVHGRPLGQRPVVTSGRTRHRDTSDTWDASTLQPCNVCIVSMVTLVRFWHLWHLPPATPVAPATPATSKEVLRGTSAGALVPCAWLFHAPWISPSQECLKIVLQVCADQTLFWYSASMLL